MANGIVSGLENILGLDTTAGTAELQQALAALQAVNVPNISQLTLPELQKYVSAGVLTPSQYEAISANPQAYQQIASQADQTGTNAQKAALQQLGGVVQQGGSTAINKANLLNNINQTNQAMQAARSGIQENAQERGVAGGGQEFLNQLMNEQSNANTANTGAVNAAANNAQLALQAMTQGGQLGGQLQGQSNQMAQAQAQAAQQVAEYNSQLQSMANQYNTGNANAAQAQNLAQAQQIGNANVGNANARTQYNAQLPGQEYNMQMQKAGGLAGAYGNLGQLKQQQAAGQNQFIGGLIGSGATLGGDYMLGQGLSNSGALKQPAYTGSNYGQSTDILKNNLPGSNSGSSLSLYADGGEVPDADMDSMNQAMRILKSGKYDDQSQKAIPVPGPSERNEIYKSPSGKQRAAHVMTAAHGGEMCYAEGGEIHDHEICMELGGKVPGQAQVPGDSTQNDTIHAKLSPHEIVLPRTVSQAPDAPQKAAEFVGQIKGNVPPEAALPMIGQALQHAATPQPLDFSAILKQLEDNGLELRLCPKGY